MLFLPLLQWPLTLGKKEYDVDVPLELSILQPLILYILPSYVLFVTQSLGKNKLLWWKFRDAIIYEWNNKFLEDSLILYHLSNNTGRSSSRAYDLSSYRILAG